MDILLDTTFTIPQAMFPRETFSDNFDRPDSSDLGVTSDGQIPWVVSLGVNTTAATFGVDANAGRIKTITGTGYAAALLDTHHLNHQMSLTLANTPTTGARWYIAAQDADNALVARVGTGGEIAITRLTAGDAANVITNLPVIGNGQVLRAHYSGTGFSVFVDGTLIHSQTLALPASFTKVGFGAYQSASVGRVDQFIVTYP